MVICMVGLRCGEESLLLALVEETLMLLATKLPWFGAAGLWMRMGWMLIWRLASKFDLDTSTESARIGPAVDERCGPSWTDR